MNINSGATDNTIGGTGAVRNLISDNAAHGVELTDSGTSNNYVIGNWIGTDSTGTGSLPNSEQ